MLGGPAISRKRALLNLVIGDLELAFEDLKEWIEAVTTQELWTGQLQAIQANSVGRACNDASLFIHSPSGLCYLAST